MFQSRPSKKDKRRNESVAKPKNNDSGSWSWNNNWPRNRLPRMEILATLITIGYVTLPAPSPIFTLTLLTKFELQSGSQYGDSPVQHDGSVQYVDDSQIYEYEHGGDHQQQHQNINGNNHDYQQQQQQQQLQQNQTRDQNYYYARGDTSQFDDDDERSDMW